MRLLGAASRSLQIGRRLSLRRPPTSLTWQVCCCWIPLFSICATRPFAVFSFQFGFQRNSIGAIVNLGTTMPLRSIRVSSSKIEAAKDGDDGLSESPQKSPRKRSRKSDGDSVGAKTSPAKSSSPSPKKKKKTTTTSKAKGTTKTTAKTKKATKTKGAKAKQAPTGSASDDESVKSTNSKGKSKAKKSPAKKKKAADHQRITEQDEIPKLWDAEKALANGSYS